MEGMAINVMSDAFFSTTKNTDVWFLSPFFLIFIFLIVVFFVLFKHKLKREREERGKHFADAKKIKKRIKEV